MNDFDIVRDEPLFTFQEEALSRIEAVITDVARVYQACCYLNMESPCFHNAARANLGMVERNLSG